MNERLRQIIKELRSDIGSGRRAESLPEDQMLLGLEDVEQSLAGEDAAAKPMTPTGTAGHGRNAVAVNRGSLSQPICLGVELIVDIDDKDLAHGCQRQLHCIGADRSERLDIVPAQFRVLVTSEAQICLPQMRGRRAAGPRHPPG